MIKFSRIKCRDQLKEIYFISIYHDLPAEVSEARHLCNNSVFLAEGKKQFKSWIINS